MTHFPRRHSLDPVDEVFFNLYYIKGYLGKLLGNEVHGAEFHGLEGGFRPFGGQ